MNQSHIRLSKKLVGIEQCANKQVRISFEDGFVDDVDLVVAADGIRSVSYVRVKQCMPKTNHFSLGTSQALFSDLWPSL